MADHQKTNHTQTRKMSKQMYFYTLGILVACEFVLSFSFLGYINIPPISITTLHILVLVAALYLGKSAGALVGLAFGLSSMWKASVLPYVTANAAFSPFISTNPFGSLVTSIGTRVLFGYLAGVILEELKKHCSEWPTIILGTFLATFLHSFLVYTSMWFFFPSFGITPMNTFASLLKVNALITYGLAYLVICGIQLFLTKTRAGKMFIRQLYSQVQSSISKSNIKGILITSGIAFVIVISLVLYFIDDMTRIFQNYNVTLTDETQNLVVNMGMQFACGTLAAFVIISLIFIYTYNTMRNERDRERISKIQFFTNLSHDMRTPLNGIIGSAELAQETKDIEEKDKYLKNVGVSGRVMLDLVNDILDVSKMENGMMQLHPEPYAMQNLIENVTLPIQTVARTKNISFHVDIENAPKGYVVIDHVNVQKIILNLLSNAAKFTPEGGSVFLTIKQLPHPVDGNNVQIVIRDTGIGISKEFLNHIYEPFSQENDGRAEKQGTGLGLMIVDRLVKLMHGSIDVTSEKGKGTEFVVQLRFPPTEEQFNTICRIDEESKILQGRKVLLSEDNDINAMIAETILNKNGAEVVRAKNGAEAVMAFKQSKENTYAAILMDLQMPVMDGYEAAKQIRALDRADAGTIKIIALSAVSFDEDIERSLQAGMNGFLEKPFNQKDLIEKIIS